VGYFPSEILISATPVQHVLDFKDITADELHTFDIPFRFVIDKTGII
jgi:histone-arginine methyltransferase CARM1